MITPWGYTITDTEHLQPMLTDAEFSVLTADKYADDPRRLPIIEAACNGIRNYCGWHVYPSQECSFSERLLRGNGRVKVTLPDILIQLPASYVSAVSSVTVDGEEWTDYDFQTNGLIRLFDIGCVTRKTVVAVTYTAGLPDAVMGSIHELIAGKANKALSSTNGVASETAGGVSISYTQSWTSGGGAGALATADADVLEPYRLREVF